MADTAKINGEQSWLDAPEFDPSAEFQVAGSGQPNDPSFGGVPNAAPRAEPVAGVPDAPRISTGQAVGIGLLDGGTFKLTDELYGAEQAAPDLPYWLRPFVLPYKAGVARLLYENIIGTPGEVTKKYQAGRDEVRRFQDATYEQRPKTYMASAIGGALGTIPFTAPKALAAGTAAIRGAVATIPLTPLRAALAQAGRSARIGGRTGLLFGMGDGRGAEDTVAKAATGYGVGAGMGAVGGAALSPLTEKVSKLMPSFTAAGSEVGGRVVGASVPYVLPRASNALDPGGTGRLGYVEKGFEALRSAPEAPPPPVWWGFP